MAKGRIRKGAKEEAPKAESGGKRKPSAIHATEEENVDEFIQGSERDGTDAITRKDGVSSPRSLCMCKS